MYIISNSRVKICIIIQWQTQQLEKPRQRAALTHSLETEHALNTITLNTFTPLITAFQFYLFRATGLKWNRTCLLPLWLSIQKTQTKIMTTVLFIVIVDYGFMTMYKVICISTLLTLQAMLITWCIHAYFVALHFPCLLFLCTCLSHQTNCWILLLNSIFRSCFNCTAR